MFVKLRQQNGADIWISLGQIQTFKQQGEGTMVKLTHGVEHYINQPINEVVNAIGDAEPPRR